MSNMISSMIELVVSNVAFLINSSDRVRSTFDLSLDDFVYALISRVFGGCLVPFDDDFLPFGFAHQRQIHDSLGLVSHHPLEHPLQMVQQPPDAPAVIEFRSVFEPAVNRFTGVYH